VDQQNGAASDLSHSQFRSANVAPAAPDHVSESENNPSLAQNNVHDPIDGGNGFATNAERYELLHLILVARYNN
jgi:hypothetical protein